MKRKLILVLGVLMTLLLVGCRNNDELTKYEGTVMGNGNIIDISDSEEDSVEAVFDKTDETVIKKNQNKQEVK